jgi:hypothetical protein
MTVPSSANYVFLSWVRRGAAAGIQTPDSLAANQAGVVSVPVKLRINNADEIERQVRLYGPGDVTGIDPLQIVRTEPRHLATDFEPNYFSAVEFDRPDFPWLFTPAKADSTGKLRPWLCLIVVRKQQGVTLRTGANLLLPVLDIDAPGRELPDLTESWAWAHVQVTGTQRDSGSLKASLAGDPSLTVSRLLCPRRLDPTTEYLACVVPAFELGRKAGLGLPFEPGEEERLDPAWTLRPEPPEGVTLPVYFHWEFRTGTADDFEKLASSLERRPLPPEVGKRPIDISRPGFQIAPPLPEKSALELEGALRLLKAAAADWPEATRTPFQAALKPILDAPWQALKQEAVDPLLAPPLYGCWQAGEHIVEIGPASSNSAWLHELNLDPRHRAVAALGTQAVQAQQEQLMAAAWEQLGEIERINQMQRQAQLGRAVNDVYYARHFSRFSAETLLKVVSTARSRVVVESTANARMLLSQSISKSAIPARAVSAPLRRLTSPRSVISTRFQSDRTVPIAIVAKLNTTSVVQFHKKDAGLVSINKVSDDPSGTFGVPLKQTVRFENAANALDATPLLGDFKIVPDGAPQRTVLDFTRGLPADSADAQSFRNAAKEHQAYLHKAFRSSTPPRSPEPMNLADTKAQLLQSVTPGKTIKARMQSSLRLDAGSDPTADPLEPVMDAPDFPQPMYEALRDLAQDFLFPGLEHVLPNSVALLETNAKFVEAFLVGLNAEMSRELLWRGYPTDQRGTYFRQFWDGAHPDIQAIKEWRDHKLGDNARTGEKLVLLLRGELLRRYPNSVIYAVAAVQKDQGLDLSRDPADERHPIFRGVLKPDVTFLGFDLEERDVLADPGWFFVIQQQPTEPRFGLDIADFDKPVPSLTTWNQLSWRHLAETKEQLEALSHASVSTVLPEVDKAKWGKSAAHQAYITLQRPVRVAIHAKEMIKLD